MITGWWHGTTATITTAWHAAVGRCRRRPIAVVGAVDKGDVVLIEAERATHDAVKTKHIAHQLDHAGKFPATQAPVVFSHT